MTYIIKINMLLKKRAKINKKELNILKGKKRMELNEKDEKIYIKILKEHNDLNQKLNEAKETLMKKLEKEIYANIFTKNEKKIFEKIQQIKNINELTNIYKNISILKNEISIIKMIKIVKIKFKELYPNNYVDYISDNDYLGILKKVEKYVML